jgi:ABC-type sugar transport system permease subunit
MAAATSSARRPRFRQRHRLALTGLLFTVPSLVLFLAFVAAPVVFALYITFNNWSTMRPPVWIGLENFQRILSDELFLRSLGNTVVYTILYVPLVTVTALLAAVMANRPLRGQYVFKALIFVPVITSAIVVGVVWFYIYNPEFGVLNALLLFLGLPPGLWLGDQRLALPALVVVSIWQRFGWFTVLLLAGLQDIPGEIKEAGAIDGASPWRSFLHITLPLLRPTLALVTVLGAISAFQVFDLVFVMTDGGPAYATHTLSYYIYVQAFRSFKMGYAAAMSYALFAVIFLLTLIQLRVLRPAADY